MKTYHALATYSPLLEAADRGAFDLPSDLAAMRTALVALAAARQSLDVPPSAAQVRARIVRESIAAAVAGKPLPDVAPVLKAGPAYDVYVERGRVLAAAEDELSINVANTIAAAGDRLITEHLRPALDDLLAELRPAAEAFAPFAHLSDVELLDAPDDARAAVLVIDQASKRYALLREAQRVTPTAVTYDTDDVLAHIANLPLLWGDVASYRARVGQRPDVKPWPAGRRAYMTWLVTATDPAPEVWMPTGTERDERWLSYFGDQIERHRRERAVRTAFARDGAVVVSPERRNMTGAQKLEAALAGPDDAA